MGADSGWQHIIDRTPVLDETESRVFTGLIDQLYARSNRVKYLPFAVIAIMALVFWPVTSAWSVFAVFAVQGAGTIIFDILRFRYRRARARRDDRLKWAWYFTAASAVTGASWGLAGVVWFMPGDTGYQALLGLVICSMVTSSVVSRAPFLPSFYVFMAASCAPPLVMLALEASTQSLTLLALAFFYLGGAAGWARGNYLTSARELAFRARNRTLAWELAKARDVAMVRAAEAQRARVAAEAGERSKSEFLSTISHEVRTPLNGIKGMSELLQDTELSDIQRDYLKTIQESAEALRVVLEDVIELSRLEGGDGEVDTATVFSPEALAREVIRIVAPEAERKGLHVSVSAGADVPPAVCGDVRRVRQILLNLLGNAVKFTDAGSVGVVISTLPKDGKRVLLRFDVRDTGIGIPEDAMPRLFERFAQVDQSITRRHGGKGLGLALCKRLALQMAGDIHVVSRFGEGSTFTLTLPVPVADTPAIAPQPARPEEAVRVDPKVLEALEAKIGREKTVGIVEAYLETAWQLAERIGKSTEAGDVEDLGRAAHDLKSAAGNLGLVALSQAASALQDHARAGNRAQALAAARTIPDETAKSHDALVHAYPAAMR